MKPCSLCNKDWEHIHCLCWLIIKLTQLNLYSGDTSIQETLILSQTRGVPWIEVPLYQKHSMFVCICILKTRSSHDHYEHLFGHVTFLPFFRGNNNVLQFKNALKLPGCNIFLKQLHLCSHYHQYRLSSMKSDLHLFQLICQAGKFLP